jgi:hypothetical protein
MKKIEYSITGNDVVPQNMIGDIFWDTLYYEKLNFENISAN